MTTKVTVDAHAGWPVRVEAVDQYPADADPVTKEIGIVPANEKQDFYVTSTRKLIISEMQRPA